MSKQSRAKVVTNVTVTPVVTIHSIHYKSPRGALFLDFGLLPILCFFSCVHDLRTYMHMQLAPGGAVFGVPCHELCQPQAWARRRRSRQMRLPEPLAFAARRRVGRRGAGTPRRPIVAARARKGRPYRLGSRAAALRSSALVRLPRLKKKEENRQAKGGMGGRHTPAWSTWSTWSAVINLTSRAGELRSAPSGPEDRYRVLRAREP